MWKRSRLYLPFALREWVDRGALEGFSEVGEIALP